MSAVPAGSAAAFIGALVFAMTGFGIGWVNAGADYSRYLPRGASPPWRRRVDDVRRERRAGRARPVRPAARRVSTRTGGAIASDPVGALTTLLPTWYLVPFALVAIGGLIGGAVLDIYSSGLTLLTLGVQDPRWAAAMIDGVLMIIGTIYRGVGPDDFIGPFQGFLITLGVPMAAWCGIFLGDLFSRRQPYAEADLYDARGRYGSVNW